MESAYVSALALPGWIRTGAFASGLTVDTFDSSAWVGLIPFVVEGLRPPYLPPLPWISRFPETNVRTYVIGPDGSRGIWFFTLEAAQRLAVIGGRMLYCLPYRYASMWVRRDGDLRTYSSSRRSRSGAALTRIGIQIGRRAQNTERDVFLTARFRMFMSCLGRLWCADVNHPSWPLYEARVTHLEETLLRSLSFDPPATDPLVLYSPGVDTRISAPRLLTGSAH